MTSENNPPKYITLWDIDGTLIQVSDLHAKAYLYALSEVFGINKIEKWPPVYGKTAPWIFRELLRLHGIRLEDLNHHFEKALNLAIEYYEEHIEEEEGYMHVGVREILRKLDHMKIPRALVTGNFRKISYLKLKKFGIEGGFCFGKYGDHHEERSELLKMAISEAKDFCGLDFNGHNMVYIADTPEDVKAAKKAGLPSVIVKTNQKKFDFSKYKPDLILENLAPPNDKKLLQFLMNHH